MSKRKKKPKRKNYNKPRNLSRVDWSSWNMHFSMGRAMDEAIGYDERPGIVSLERQVAQDKMAMLKQTDFRQYVVKFNKILAKPFDGRYLIYRHFSGMEHFFTRHDTQLGVVERSRIYETTKLAMTDLLNKQVTWVEFTTEFRLIPRTDNFDLLQKVQKIKGKSVQDRKNKFKHDPYEEDEEDGIP